MISELIRGGQTSLHGFRMAGQIIKVVLYTIIIITGLSAGWHTWKYANDAPYHKDLAFTYVKVKTLYAFRSDEARINWKYQGGNGSTISIATVRKNSPTFKFGLNKMTEAAITGAIRGGIGSTAVVFLILAAFWARGRKLVHKTHVTGARLVSVKELSKFVRKSKLGASKYKIAGVPWTKGGENLHTLIIGTTGSGKTVSILEILDQIEANGDKAIVYDKLGSFIPHYYKKNRDYILNPFDKRDACWDLFAEATSATDFNAMAAALIPEFKDTAEPFWVRSARLLFSNAAAMLWRKGDHDIRNLVKLLVRTNLTELATQMKDTEVQSIIDKDNPKTALSVRAILTTYITPLTFLKKAKKSFSIRKWVQDDSKSGFLFLSSDANTHELRRAQIATQLELAITALLSMHRNENRKVWIIIDELPSLHKIPSLPSGLREIRQFGGAIVLGAQVFSEINDLYGREMAKTISGNCNTRICLASPDRDTANWMSDNFGNAMVQYTKSGLSYGADTLRDGVSLTEQEDLKKIILPSDIMTLPQLCGYLKLPFESPAAKIKLKPKNRKEVADGLIRSKESDNLLDDQVSLDNMIDVEAIQAADNKSLEDKYNSLPASEPQNNEAPQDAPPPDNVPPPVADPTDLFSTDPAQDAAPAEPVPGKKVKAADKPIEADSAPPASSTLVTDIDRNLAEMHEKAAEDKRVFAIDIVEKLFNSAVEKLFTSVPDLDSDGSMTKKHLEDLYISGVRLLDQLKTNSVDADLIAEKIVGFMQLNTKPPSDDPGGYDDINAHTDLCMVIDALEFSMTKTKTKAKANKRAAARVAGKAAAIEKTSSKTKAKTAPASEAANIRNMLEQEHPQANAASAPLFDSADGKPTPKTASKEPKKDEGTITRKKL